MLVPLVAVLAVLDLALAHVLRSVRPPTRLRPRQTLQSVEGSVTSPNGTTFNSVIVPLTLSKDQQSYYTVIQAGNTSFRVALDTGSADLWLISSACTTSACSSVPKYQLAYQSPTFVSVNSNQTLFNASFADGTDADGFVALETVQLSNLTVPNQALGLVTSTNVTVGDQVSGLLGLGFPRLSRIFNSGVVNATPFFATMAQRGQLDYPLFGLSLTRNSSGTLALGAVDGSVVTNASLIEWNEVVPFAPFGSESNTTSYLQWTVPLSTIFVGNTSIAPHPTYPNATSSSYSLALLDVGTSGIFGPYQDVSRIYSAIAGSRLVSDGQWAVPCDVNTTLSFQFNQQKFVLQPTDFLIGPASGDPNLCLSWPRALPPSSDGIDWQLGASFLRTVYSIFSLGIDAKEPPFVGLYPLRSPLSTSTPDPLSSISAFFSSISGTIGTTLPNFPLPTPSTFTLPPYTFNTSSPIPHPTPGLIVSSGLATSTYVPVLGTHHMNVSAIPTLSPSPTLATFLLTDAQGHVSTSVSTASLASVTLGTPPGWTSGGVLALRGVVDLRVVGAVVLGLVVFC